MFAISLLAVGCETTGGSGGGAGATKHGTLFLKVFNEDGQSLGPTDIKLKLDGAEILHRNFAMDENSYDGQYQVTLPQGRHLLEASSMQGAQFTSRAFNLKDEAFIQVYVTEEGKWRLTPSSRRSLGRLVIRRVREARGIYSDPALWMIIPPPKPATPTRTQYNFAGQPPSAGDTKALRPSQRGKP